MKNLVNLKKLTLLMIVFGVTFFALGCSANKTSTSNIKNAAVSKSYASNSDATKQPKEVKVLKPNEGGLKQELNTKAEVSTTDKKQITFEVPVNQLQGLKVGDALVVNSGTNAYPAQITTIPPANTNQLSNPNVIGNPNSATKVIVTAQIGPGINLPGNKSNYTVTYLYNNREPHSYYINKNYVYYDYNDRPYVYITGPDRVIRRKYIRTGLINRYYAELLDQFDAAERIVEAYKDYYIENVVVPQIIEDYTNQVINEYYDYIDSLNKRWDYNDDINTITIDVNDVDWNKLEEQDIILTDQDITEIYEDIQTNSKDDNDTNNNINDTDDTDNNDYNIDSNNDYNIDSSDYSSIENASNDRDSSDDSSIENASNDRDSSDDSSIENASNDRDSSDSSSNESYSNDYTSNDISSYDNTSNDSNSNDNSSYDNDSNDSDSNDNSSYDNYSNDNDNNSDNNDLIGDDNSDYDYETTTSLDDDN